MKTIVIVAGGTGGHINAALALGEEFEFYNYNVYYITGTRELDFKLYAQKQNVYHLNVLGLRYKNVIKIVKSLMLNLWSFFKCLKMIWRIDPDAVIGTGGYVCGVCLTSSYLLNVKTYIIEQNSFLGLTNKLLAKFSNKIFLNYENTIGLPNKFRNKSIVTGNPIRKFAPNVEITFGAKEDIRVLVIGGSLGANEINLVCNELISKWSVSDRPLAIIHQTGNNKLTSNNIISSNVKYESHEYINNVIDYYIWADIIIARAGASTLSELEVLGKPCYLFPFRLATDDHQFYNAKLFKSKVNFNVEVHDAKSDINAIEKLTNFLNNHEINRQVTTVNDMSVMASKKISDLVLRDIQCIT
jgi:UDP-N-acetylglucosamine--N-acetylmuramyl-(pentapeptide) pyrophosphoryl-undecaprenol N-acetylglucosamine transferase